MYSDIVDSDILSFLMWLYYLPLEIMMFMFSLGFWSMMIWFVFSKIRDMDW